MLAYRLKGEVLAQVRHRHGVFTIPRRFRGYFRYDRKLLGKLSTPSGDASKHSQECTRRHRRAAYETVCDVFKLEIMMNAKIWLENVPEVKKNE